MLFQFSYLSLENSSTFLWRVCVTTGNLAVPGGRHNTGVLFALFQLQGHGALVAYFCWAEVLDWTRIYEAGIFCPFFAMCSKFLEGCAVQTNQCLADYGLHFAITTFHVHHHRDGHTAGNPFFCRSRCVLDDGHVACLAIGNELGCACAKCVAVVSIVVGRSGATSFVAEEVVLCCKLAAELACFFQAFNFLATISERSFSVSMRETCTFPCGSRSMVSCLATPSGRLS